MLAMGLVGLVVGSSSAGVLLINEVYVNPPGVDDDLEWIELLNTTNGFVAAEGYLIQTTKGYNDAFVSTVLLPGDIFIPPYGYLVIAESAVDTSGVQYPALLYQPVAGLNIDLQNGESHTEGVRLLDPTSAVADTVIYSTPNSRDIPGDPPDTLGEYPVEMPLEGESLARCPHGSDSNYCAVDFLRMTTTMISMGEQNSCVAPTVTRTPTATPTLMYTLTPTVTPTPAAVLEPGSVLINEFVYDGVGSDTSFENEWLELLNTTDADINLDGCRIEAAGTAFNSVCLLGNYTIPAYGYLLLYEADVTPPPDCDPYCVLVNFQPDLQNGGAESDGVRLVDSIGVVIDTVIYDAPNANNLPDDSGLPASSFAPVADENVSLARCPDGVDLNLSGQDFVTRPSDLHSPGGPNVCATITPTQTTTPAATATPAPGSPSPTITPNCPEPNLQCDTELLLNPGMEFWTYIDQPVYWEVAGPNITTSQEDGIVHSGTKSCRIQWTTTDTRYLYQVIGVRQFSAYEFSCYVYDADVNGRMRLWVQWLDINGAVLGSSESPYTVNIAQWQQVSTGSVIAPRGAFCASIQIRVYDDAGWTGSATIYVDDVHAHLECVPALSTWGIMLLLALMIPCLTQASRRNSTKPRP